MKFWIGLLGMLSAGAAHAQTLTGIVYDGLSSIPLDGATVSVPGSVIRTITNAQGRYKIMGLSPERVSIIVTHSGYESLRVNDVWIKSGVFTARNIYLDRSFAGDLDEVVITAPKAISTPGRVAITEEQINRFAATYYDPARLTTSAPDIAVTNDQNNQVSVRGLSPNYNVWRLEGAEIVNPNHLSNAGTFFDQPSATGGGLNMLSAQMLGHSEFLYSTFDNRFGNSTGGVFDMKLKAGTDHGRKYIAQASLIGFDLATEGPFKKEGKATYAANYRYSFTGLLNNLGVDFGGEAIGFQDLSFALETPTGSRSSLKVFGVGGLSSNQFNHIPYQEAGVLKDRQDIYYTNKTGIVGARFNQGFTDGNVSATLAFSGTANKRDENNYALTQDLLLGQSQTHHHQSMLSFSVNNEWYLGRSLVSSGIMANRYYFGYSPGNLDAQEKLKRNLFRPYVQLHTQLSPAIDGKVGISAAFSNGFWTGDPRVHIKWQLSDAHAIGGAAGRYSQLLTPFNFYFSNPLGNVPQNFSGNTDLEDFLISDRVTLSHTYLNQSFSIRTEVFNYYFPEVKTGLVADKTDQAKTYGFSMMLDKSFSSNFYARVGASLFDSKIEKVDNYNNAQYSINLALGIDWDFSNADKSRVLSLNIRGMYQGGNVPYYSGAPVGGFLYEERYYYKLKPYRRFDVRIAWLSYRQNCTISIALDLQNAANIQNEAFQQYNPYSKEWEMQYQLGLIPILAYRVEW